jgi:hypothetical protein
MAEGQADRRVMWTLAVQTDPGARETIDQFIAQLERIPRNAGTVAIGTAAGGGNYANAPQQAYTGPAQGPSVAAQGGAGVVAGASGAGYSTTYPSPPPPGSTLSADPRVGVSEGSQPTRGGIDPGISRSLGGTRDARGRAALDASLAHIQRMYQEGSLSHERYTELLRGLGVSTAPQVSMDPAQRPGTRRVLDVGGTGGPTEFNTGVYRPAWLSDQRRMERTHKEEDKQESSYEDRFVRERHTATSQAMGKAERQSRFGETAADRMKREIAESRHQYELGNITPQQYLAAKGGIERQYDTRQAQERNRLEKEYFSTQQRIESAQASIHRQMSYASMAAMELGRGFGYLGAMAGKSTEQVLKLLAATEAVFAIGRGVTLGMSAMENIAKQRKLLEHAGMRAAGVGASGTVRAEGLAGRVVGGIPQWETGGALGVNPAAVGAGWVAGGGASGLGLGALGSGLATAGGIMAGTAAVGLGGVEAAGHLFGMGSLVGGAVDTAADVAWKRRRMQAIFDVRAQRYVGQHAQAGETAPIYEASQARYERETEIQRRQASIGVRERGIGGLPSPWRPERPMEEARLEYEQQKARQTKADEQLLNATAAHAMAVQQEQDAAKRRDTAQRRIFQPTYKLATGEIVSEEQLPEEARGMSRAAWTERRKQGIELPEIWEQRQKSDSLKQASQLGVSENVVGEKAKRLADAQQRSLEEHLKTPESLRKMREAEAAYTRSLYAAAKENALETQGRASSATRSIMERRQQIGSMNIGEQSKLRVAIGMVEAGADPRMMPPEYKQMIEAGLGGYDLQQKLKRQEVDIGAQFGKETGIEKGDMRRKELADRAINEAAGRFVPPGADKPLPPTPGGVGDLRVKLVDTDSTMLRESVDAEKGILNVLLAINTNLFSLHQLAIGRQTAEAAANKQSGVPPGAPPLNVGPITRQAN